MKIIHAFLFEQKNAEQRRELFILSLLIILIILIVFGPYHELIVDYSKILNKNEVTPMGSLDIFLKDKILFNTLRYSIVLFTIISFAKRLRTWSLLILFFPPVCSYTSHEPLLILLISIFLRGGYRI